MKLYHGTNSDFAGICLGKSKLGKDFGAGFYLTPEESIAKRQAQRKFVQYGFDSPTVQAYEWNEEKSADLKILRFDKYDIAWAEFILLNRRNMTRQQLHDYDIVIGPIADDTIGFQIRRVEDGVITIEQFLNEIKFNHITFQYFFATEKALTTLTRL